MSSAASGFYPPNLGSKSGATFPPHFWALVPPGFFPLYEGSFVNGRLKTKREMKKGERLVKGVDCAVKISGESFVKGEKVKGKKLPSPLFVTGRKLRP